MYEEYLSLKGLAVCAFGRAENADPARRGYSGFATAVVPARQLIG